MFRCRRLAQTLATRASHGRDVTHRQIQSGATRTGASRAPGAQRGAMSSAIFFGTPVIVTFSLGVWQTRRLSRKRELIAQREVALSQAPLTEAALDTTDTENRRITLHGTLLHEQEMLVGPRGAPSALPAPALQWGGTSGYMVVTPFRTEKGRIVLVVRGWVPQRVSARDRRAGAVVRPHTSREVMDYGDAKTMARDVTFTGVLRIADERNRFMPVNNPLKNEWYYVDVNAMLESHELSGITDTERAAFVELVEPIPECGWPFPRTFQDFLHFRTPPSTHIIYAATWFSLSAFLALLSRNRLKARNVKQ